MCIAFGYAQPMSRPFSLIFLLFLCLSVPALGAAQTAPAAAPPEIAIEEVVVTGSRLASGNSRRLRCAGGNARELMGYVAGKEYLAPTLAAISSGAVFMGANTYIGNGPNFMVKSIADHQKVHTPTFLGYLWKYSLPIMLPMLVLVWLLFFR